MRQAQVDGNNRRLRTTRDDPNPVGADLIVGDPQMIVGALAALGGNQTEAARKLGITRRTLIYRMEKFGLKPPPASRG